MLEYLCTLEIYIELSSSIVGHNQGELFVISYMESNNFWMSEETRTVSSQTAAGP